MPEKFEGKINFQKKLAVSAVIEMFTKFQQIPFNGKNKINNKNK